MTVNGEAIMKKNGPRVKRECFGLFRRFNRKELVFDWKCRGRRGRDRKESP